MADIKIYGTLKNVTNEPIANAEQIGNLAIVATSGSYNDLEDKPTIPTSISQLSEDSVHRTVTDNEKNDYTYAAEQFKEHHTIDYKNGIGKWNETSIIISNDGNFIFENYVITNNTKYAAYLTATLVRNGESTVIINKEINPKNWPYGNTLTLNETFDVLSGDIITFKNPLISTTNSETSVTISETGLAYLSYIVRKTIPTKTSDLTNDSGFLTEHQDISGKQDVLVSGTNIKTINNNSIVGSGNLSVGTVTGIKMNDISKDTSGIINLGTVITGVKLGSTTLTPSSGIVTIITTSLVTSDNNTPITSSGVYNALQNYEKKMSFTSVSSLPSTCVVNTYYRITSSKTSLAVTLPSSSLTAGDTIGISFTTGSSITTPTVSGGTIYKQDGWSTLFEANATYEIVALYDGEKWLVTSTKFKS